MSRSKKAQFLLVGGQHDGSHHICEAADDGSPLNDNIRFQKIEPFTQADWRAQEATRTVQYVQYNKALLRGGDEKRYWVYVADGVNLMAALIDGYRRQA